MARCVHGVPLGGPNPCPTCAPPEQPICGIQEDARRGWIKVCMLPKGHPRTGPVKHRFEWHIGTPGSDADPNGPGPEPTTDLPRRTPTPAPEPAPPEPTQLGYRRKREGRTTPPPRRGDRRVGFPLGDPERVQRGGEQFTSERDSDANTDDYGQPVPTPLPAGVEGHSAGTSNRGEGSVASVAEVSAAFAAANGKIEEAQQAIHNAIHAQEEAAQLAAGAADGSGYEAVHVGLAALTDARVHLEDAIAADENAREQFQTYVARL